jgi:hypothetical protein
MNSLEEIKAMNLHEIKYRAFDLVDKKMLYTDWTSFRNWYDLEKGGVVMEERGFDGEKRLLSKPMQFSTIHDKEGADLYEEDLVRATYIERLQKWPKKEFKEILREDVLFRVEKDQGCFRFTDGLHTVWFHELFLKEDRIIDSRDYVVEDRFDRRYHKFINFMKVGDSYMDPDMVREKI